MNLAYSLSAVSSFPGGGSGKLFRYIQTINFLLGSPTMAIYFVGLVWPRANQPGALGGFLIGLALAAARFATEYIYASPACGEEDTRPAFAAINYMYFGKYKCIDFRIRIMRTDF